MRHLKKLLYNGIKITKQGFDVICLKSNRIWGWSGPHYARKSFLYNKEIPWQEKSINLFDVAVGAYDGIEVYELAGLFLLNNLANTFD